MVSWSVGPLGSPSGRFLENQAARPFLSFSAKFLAVWYAAIVPSVVSPLSSNTLSSVSMSSLKSSAICSVQRKIAPVPAADWMNSSMRGSSFLLCHAAFFSGTATTIAFSASSSISLKVLSDLMTIPSVPLANPLFPTIVVFIPTRLISTLMATASDVLQLSYQNTKQVGILLLAVAIFCSLVDV